MNFNEIQIGLDIATAISVITAAFAFIYSNIAENKKNRNAELLEQKKLRDLRVREFKLEKITHIIQFLNKAFFETIEINAQINMRLQFKEESNKIRISHSDKRKISYLLRNDEIMYFEIPDDFRIKDKLYKLTKIQNNIKNHLSHNPFIDLIDDKRSKESLDLLINLEATYFEQVSDIERSVNEYGYVVNNGLGFYLNTEIKKGHLPKGENRKKIVSDNKDKQVLPSNYEELICDACYEDFELLQEKKKIKIYYQFLRVKLEKINSLRSRWINLSTYTEDAIHTLSLHSYNMLQNYEDNKL